MDSFFQTKTVVLLPIFHQEGRERKGHGGQIEEKKRRKG